MAAKGAPKQQTVTRRPLACDDFPPLNMADLRRDVADTYDGEAFCRSIIEDIVVATEPDVVAAYMDEVAVPWAVQGVLTDVVEALAFAFLEREQPMPPHQQQQQQACLPQGPVAAGHLRPEGAASDDDSDSDGARSVQELGDIASASRALLVGGDDKPAPMSADVGIPTSPAIVVDAAADERPTTLTARDGPRDQLGAPQHADPAGVTWSEAGMEPAPMTEPVMVPADSWCRASIMQRRRIHERRTSDAAASDVEAANPSSATFRRAKSRAYAAGDSDPGENSSSKLKGLLKTSSTMVAHTPKSSKSGAHAKFPSQAEGSSNEGGGGGSSTSPGPSPSDVLDEEKRLQLAVNESMNRMKALRAMSESVHKQISSLRSGANATPFVIDGTTHQVLEVQTLEPKSLPPQRAEPRVGIPGQDAELEAERILQQQQLAAAAKGAPGSRQGGRAQTPGGGGDKKPRGKRKEERPEAFWQPEPNSNPMVAEVTPAAGVTHRDGESVRTSELKPPKSRVSRQEYAKLLSMQMTTQQQRAMDEEQENVTAAAKDKDASGTKPSVVTAKATEPRATTTTTTTSSADAEKKAVAAVATNGKKAGGQAASSRVGTPKLVPRPSSENSGTMRRHPVGGVVPHSRGNSRVSTPAPGMSRKLASERPSSTASHRQASIGSTIPASRVQSANVASMPRARTGLPQMRLLDAEDDVARDFLSSLVASGGGASVLTDEEV